MKISKELVRSLLLLFPLLIIITFFNRYIFDDGNLIFFTFLLFLYLAINPLFKVERKLLINLNVFYLLSLLIYFIIRFGESDIHHLRPETDISNIGPNKYKKISARRLWGEMHVAKYADNE